jgi:hypothetical protein
MLLVHLPMMTIQAAFELRWRDSFHSDQTGVARKAAEARQGPPLGNAPACGAEPARSTGQARQTAMGRWSLSGRAARAARPAILCLALAQGAAAHDWYDPTCCTGQDCAPVPSAAIEGMSDGYHVTLLPGDHPLIRRPLRTVVPYGDPRINWSQDSRPHACVVTGRGGYQGLICIFVTGAGG